MSSSSGINQENYMDGVLNEKASEDTARHEDTAPARTQYNFTVIGDEGASCLRKKELQEKLLQWWVHKKIPRIHPSVRLINNIAVLD